MLYSMTGFGKDVYSNEKFTLETEVKSLNSRYLDLSVRLPKELNQFEFSVRDLIKNKIIRGKVSVFVNLSVNSGNVENLVLNETELTKVSELLSKINSTVKSNVDLSLNNLLLFRESFIEQSEAKFELEEEVLLNSISNATDKLIEMRGQEGSQLKLDINNRITAIEDNLKKVEGLVDGSIEDYFNKFKEKAKKLYDEFIDDKDRFLLELGILSEKHDVTEECIRLHSHIKLFKETLLKPRDIGRKLNFICQEMNREVNTINSKSISSEISHIGMNIKEELEKIREQVQNVE